ncbi:MAG: TonB-dependent hemoglobin/transferrin/lactoferrin family receptor [Guyparkeria sp.]
MTRALIHPSRLTAALLAASIPATTVAATAAHDPAAPSLPITVVTAERLDMALDEIASPVSVLERAAIVRDQPRDQNDLYRMMPGVTTGGGPRSTAQQPVIRGLGDERVVIRMDGARQNFSSGHRGRVFLDPFLLDRVEVRRGPASTLYGSGAIGGVVNFHTLDADGFLRPGASGGGRVTAGYRSQGEAGMIAATGALRSDDDGAGLIASVLRRDTSDMTSGSGDRIPNTGDDILSGMLKGHFVPADGHRLTLTAQSFRDDHELPSAANTDSSSNIVDRRTDSRTLSARYQLAPTGQDWLELDLTAYRTRTDLDERRLDDGRHDQTELTTTGLDLVNVSRFATGRVGHRLIAGIEAYRDEQSGRRDGAARPQFPDGEQTVTGAFLVDHVQLGEHFELAPGMRLDRFEQDGGDGLDRNESEWSGQLTATWRPIDSLALHGGWAQAFRAPSLTELYVGGEHFPGNVFVPNPDLRPETADNKEVGLTFTRDDLLTRGDSLRLQATAFRNDVDDFIERRVVFDSFFPVMTGRTLTENVTEARIDGQELELHYRRDDAYLHLAATRLRGTNESEGGPLDGLPGDEVALEGGVDLAGGRWTVGGRVTGVAGQDRVTDATATPGYALLDLFATWFPAGFGRDLRLDFGIDNVFDRAYRPHLSALDDPGRDFRIQASYRF